MADAPIPQDAGAPDQAMSESIMSQPLIQQEGPGAPIQPTAPGIQADLGAPATPSDEAAKKRRTKSELLRICSIATRLILVYLPFIFAALFLAPNFSQYWDNVSKFPEPASKSRAEAEYRGNVYNAAGARESLLYDSIRDRVFRFVTSTKHEKLSQPTVVTETYIWQGRDKSTAVPVPSGGTQNKVGDQMDKTANVAKDKSPGLRWFSGSSPFSNSDEMSPASEQQGLNADPTKNEENYKKILDTLAHPTFGKKDQQIAQQPGSGEESEDGRKQTSKNTKVPGSSQRQTAMKTKSNGPTPKPISEEQSRVDGTDTTKWTQTLQKSSKQPTESDSRSGKFAQKPTAKEDVYTSAIERVKKLSSVDKIFNGLFPVVSLFKLGHVGTSPIPFDWEDVSEYEKERFKKIESMGLTRDSVTKPSDDKSKLRAAKKPTAKEDVYTSAIERVKKLSSLERIFNWLFPVASPFKLGYVGTSPIPFDWEDVSEYEKERFKEVESMGLTRDSVTKPSDDKSKLRAATAKLIDAKKSLLPAWQQLKKVVSLGLISDVLPKAPQAKDVSDAIKEKLDKLVHNNELPAFVKKQAEQISSLERMLGKPFGTTFFNSKFDEAKEKVEDLLNDSADLYARAVQQEQRLNALVKEIVKEFPSASELKSKVKEAAQKLPDKDALKAKAAEQARKIESAGEDATHKVPTVSESKARAAEKAKNFENVGKEALRKLSTASEMKARPREAAQKLFTEKFADAKDLGNEMVSDLPLEWEDGGPNPRESQYDEPRPIDKLHKLLESMPGGFPAFLSRKTSPSAQRKSIEARYDQGKNEDDRKVRSDNAKAPEFPSNNDHWYSTAKKEATKPEHGDDSKESSSASTPKSSSIPKKGRFRDYWSKIRMEGPPTNEPQGNQSKEATSDSRLKSSSTQRKGAFEEYWSEFRMQGPPTAATSSPGENEGSRSPLTPKSGARTSVGQDKQRLEDDRTSLHEKSASPREQISQPTKKSYPWNQETSEKKDADMVEDSTYAKEPESSSGIPSHVDKETKYPDPIQSIKNAADKLSSQFQEKVDSAKELQASVKKAAEQVASQIDENVKSAKDLPESLRKASKEVSAHLKEEVRSAKEDIQASGKSAAQKATSRVNERVSAPNDLSASGKEASEKVTSQMKERVESAMHFEPSSNEWSEREDTRTHDESPSGPEARPSGEQSSEKEDSSYVEDHETSVQRAKLWGRKTSANKDPHGNEQTISPTGDSDSGNQRQDASNVEITADDGVTMKPLWYWRLMSRIGIPEQLPNSTSKTSRQTSFRADKDNAAQSTADDNSTKSSSKITHIRKVESKGRQRAEKVKSAILSDKGASKPEQGSKQTPTPKQKITKSTATTTKNYQAGSPQSPPADEISRGTSSSEEASEKNPREVMVDVVLDAIRDYSDPEYGEKQNWEDWATSFLDLSWVGDYFKGLKARMSSLPEIFTSMGGIHEKENEARGETASGEKSGWTWNPFSWRESESDRTPLREQTFEEMQWEEKFFSHPNYQHQSATNKTSEVILEISGTLYSVIDQLMAEGNKHFATMTRLQDAWSDLHWGEAVMNSSQTVKTLAADTETRDLQKTYVEVVHKFDRLVDDIAEATRRIVHSPVLTEADANRWIRLKGGSNKFLHEVRKRPLFTDKEALIARGFHKSILLGGRDKLDVTKSALKGLIAVSTV